MIIGFVTIALGFTIMALDPNPQGFGFMGLTLSPIIVLSGFGLEIYAILYSPKNGESKGKTK